MLRPSTQASTPYTHNGLGYRICWHHDVDADATVENTSDDPWYTFCYGERWRIVETYREGDTYPKEQFYYHNAGMSGMGGSSSIDSVLLRRRDVTNGWAGSADGIMEESTYYCQNWRSDVSVLLDASGDVMERDQVLCVRDAHVPPSGRHQLRCCCQHDGQHQIATWTLAPIYDVRGDINLDGVVNGTDSSLYAAASMGRGILTGTGNRKGYGGYENDGVLADSSISGSNSRFWHVRHRVLNSTMGRWTRRDPIGYVDGSSLLQYVNASPITDLDPTGLISRAACDDGLFCYNLWGSLITTAGGMATPLWRGYAGGRDSSASS